MLFFILTFPIVFHGCLCSVQRMKLVRIRKDMTPMEREEDLKLKREYEGKKEKSTKPSGYGEEEKL